MQAGCKAHAVAPLSCCLVLSSWCTYLFHGRTGLHQVAATAMHMHDELHSLQAICLVHHIREGWGGSKKINGPEPEGFQCFCCMLALKPGHCFVNNQAVLLCALHPSVNGTAEAAQLLFGCSHHQQNGWVSNRQVGCVRLDPMC